MLVKFSFVGVPQKLKFHPNVFFLCVVQYILRTCLHKVRMILLSSIFLVVFFEYELMEFCSFMSKNVLNFMS